MRVVSSRSSNELFFKSFLAFCHLKECYVLVLFTHEGSDGAECPRYVPAGAPGGGSSDRR